MAGIVPINFQMTDTAKDLINGLVDERLHNKARIAELDAELNGQLVEVGQIYGKPLYIRDDIHDPVQLRYLVEEIQSTFRAAFYLTGEKNNGRSKYGPE